MIYISPHSCILHDLMRKQKHCTRRRWRTSQMVSTYICIYIISYILYVYTGDYKRALFNIQHALSVSSDDVKLHITLSKVLRVMGNLQDAYTAIQKAGMCMNVLCA